MTDSPIQRMTKTDLALLDTVDNRHLDAEVVVVRLSEGGLGLSFKPAKTAQWRVSLPDAYLRPEAKALLPGKEGEGEGAALFAFAENGTLAGQIVVTRHIHRLARVADLRVTLSSRKQGIGRALLQAGERWAWQQGFVGMAAETQDNNPGACQFLLKCGYRFGGVDVLRYAGLPGRIAAIDAMREAALSFYRLFT